jgi:hypothetical protein
LWARKKSKLAYIKWLPVCILLLAFIAVIIWTAWCDAQQEAEWGYELNVIQSIIENIAVYQDEIESWGYQMSVLTPDEKPEDEALQYYYRNYYQPILVLTDADGGKYCFCYGFDGYTSVVSYTVMVERTSGECEEALKTVRLELTKHNRYQAPFEENLNEVGVSAYYDMLVEINVKTFSVDEGKTIWNESGFWCTNYCSNNFVDCMRFGIGEVEREENSRSADCHIKQEYSAKQLLAFYRQGLDLQGRLIELYQSRISDK